MAPCASRAMDVCMVDPPLGRLRWGKREPSERLQQIEHLRATLLVVEDDLPEREPFHHGEGERRCHLEEGVRLLRRGKELAEGPVDRSEERRVGRACRVA